ncbi:MAG: F0F1 ATP synthase subunit B [Candidatus Levybacteria bacterium]|nr:F0F1 ATP synthase subunit B [Candidatus Levybacteria bacterium]
MEIINNLGIDPLLLVAQGVNFLIILYILKRFAYKPILSMLKSREDTIRKGIKQAEDARILLEKTQEKEKQILKKAQAEAKMMIEKTKEEQIKIIQDAREKGKLDMDLLLEEARKQIAFETKEAEKKLTVHISEIAMLFLKKSLSELLTD